MKRCFEPWPFVCHGCVCVVFSKRDIVARRARRSRFTRGCLQFCLRSVLYSEVHTVLELARHFDNYIASQNSPRPYFKTEVPGGASPPPIPCAARFRRHSIFAAPKLQACSARRRQSSPTPGAAQFRRQLKFDAPILQGCSARRRQPSPTPGAAQFRRQSKFAAPILQDCSARRRQPSPTPGPAQFRRQ